MFSFLLVVHALIASALVGVILMQRSEGGGFAGGGSPAGLMSARGAADFLTRTTAVLAVLFVTLSILISALAGVNRKAGGLDDSLKRPVVDAAPAAPAQPVTPEAQNVTPEQQAALLAQQKQAFEQQQKQAADAQRRQESERRAAQPKIVAPKVAAPTVGNSTPKVTKVEIAPAAEPATGSTTPPQ